MLNHADGLHLEKFTDADLDQIADCDDILEIDLRSNRTAQPVDLSRLAHIKGLRRLSLERMQFANLQHVRSIGKAADFAGELPPGVSWIIAPSDVHVEREALARFEFGPQSLYRFDQAGACQ